MKRFFAAPLLLCLMSGLAHAEYEKVLVSVEGSDFSAGQGVFVGSSMTTGNGDVQKVDDSASCSEIGKGLPYNPGHEIPDLGSGNQVIIMPMVTDDSGVKTFVKYTQQVLKDPVIEQVKQGCTMPTGLAHATSVSRVDTFQWGVPKKVKVLGGQSLTITIEKIEPDSK
ncbi:hypothetical protein [Pseudomonas amygdali]|uniref:Uncharacterized protein n=2 Tax=Pseudomonas amygdali pv. lachrymans TaxID=53707 RepID=A0ABR5KRB2_PSEAV|nr:hypothetical protein [Pseudomonas amygdali]AXH59626.1 hypothetical protein PLA107_030855 [Pseudomonas amygdali pv. lachrymans str. M301315]KPC17056.1 Uncharacterized protein AC499_0258 [Pseudomonas amygdali pv. lachrymans]KPC18015.1 Uncharacterized protein AC499_1217 [Pseudomonas amygdali pv. lachrymans]